MFCSDYFDREHLEDMLNVVCNVRRTIIVAVGCRVLLVTVM
jgi:hypothetical protein